MSFKQMICDVSTGVCGEAGESNFQMFEWNQPPKKLKLYYVTDPICSHCWALEPVLRRFEVQYGHLFTIHTVVGGLLKNWDGFADVKNGIGSPADVAGHWLEVGEHSRMPIDGSLWLDNPIQSSYPSSRVFKVIQQTDEAAARTFLRRAREAVFAFNRNIGEKRVLIDIVNQIGLDGDLVVKEAEEGYGQQLLDQDFALASSLGVRGFPTIVLIDEENKGIKVVGAQKLETYVKALEQALGTENIKAKSIPVLAKLLEQEALLFSKEVEVMYDLQQNEVEAFLQKELSAEAYSWHAILGERYVART